MGLHLANDDLDQGFTTLGDLGSADPAWPTVDLRNAIATRTLAESRLVVAAHLVGSTSSHADVDSLYPPRRQLPVSDPADGYDLYLDTSGSAEPTDAIGQLSMKRGHQLLEEGPGHGRLAGMVLGSVSEHCVAHDHYPVVVFRQ